MSCMELPNIYFHIDSCHIQCIEPKKFYNVLFYISIKYATTARVLPPRFARRHVVGRILDMNSVHMRPPLAIHGSVAVCLNIVFKHGYITYRTLRTSKLQTYRIYS